MIHCLNMIPTYYESGSDTFETALTHHTTVLTHTVSMTAQREAHKLF